MIDTAQITAFVFIISAVFLDAKTAFIMAAVVFGVSTLLWFVDWWGSVVMDYDDDDEC